jgi:hypothetical protein
MPRASGRLQCYVDESIHTAHEFVVTAFTFAKRGILSEVAPALRGAGITPRKQEYKSGMRMDEHPEMRAARDALLQLAGSRMRVGICIAPYSDRRNLGRDTLQALQSIMVRNGIKPSRTTVYFDQGIFPSAAEATRLKQLFHFLRPCVIYPVEDSRARLGIQVSDAVAASFGQIVKEELTGQRKMVDVGPLLGWTVPAMESLGWELLTRLRRGLFTRPFVSGEAYAPATDPVVLDPIYDDVTIYGQNPVLLGWGVQVAPEADGQLRKAVEEGLGRVWLGCVH